MKKLFYILTILTVSASIFSSCTKEEVKPKTNDPGRIIVIKE